MSCFFLTSCWSKIILTCSWRDFLNFCYSSFVYLLFRFLLIYTNVYRPTRFLLSLPTVESSILTLMQQFFRQHKPSNLQNIYILSSYKSTIKVGSSELRREPAKVKTSEAKTTNDVWDFLRLRKKSNALQR